MYSSTLPCQWSRWSGEWRHPSSLDVCDLGTIEVSRSFDITATRPIRLKHIRRSRYMLFQGSFWLFCLFIFSIASRSRLLGCDLQFHGLWSIATTHVEIPMSIHRFSQFIHPRPRPTMLCGMGEKRERRRNRRGIEKEEGVYSLRYSPMARATGYRVGNSDETISNSHLR